MVERRPELRHMPDDDSVFHTGGEAARMGVATQCVLHLSRHFAGLGISDHNLRRIFFRAWNEQSALEYA